MKPLVVEYLRTHTFRELEDEHGVCARPSVSFDKFSLNYDQILAKSGDPVTEQCRGMVVRLSEAVTKAMLRDEVDRVAHKEPLSSAKWRDRIVGDVELLAWPMNRFYNHGDAAAAPVDWSDSGLRVQEKLDGTCVIVYWDGSQSKWHAATRSVPEADLPIRKDDMELGDMTFSDLFWKAAELTVLDRHMDGWDLREHLDRSMTYVFELTSPYNRVVVKYDAPRVTLLAVRELATGRELNVDEYKGLAPISRPQQWSLHEPKALAAFIDSADPSKLEGAVVVDSRFNRVKVKSRAWVLSSRAKDLVTVSKRSAVEAIIRGTIDDVIPLVEKDVAAALAEMQVKVREYFLSMDRNFVEWKAIACGDRKLFAEKVILSNDWSAPYFNLWEGRAATVSEWAQSMAMKDKLNTAALDAILKKIGG